MVDVDTSEIVGAWLANVTAQQPLVTKAYDIDLAVASTMHKRISYTNPWPATRVFRLSSSDPAYVTVQTPRLEVSAAV